MVSSMFLIRYEEIGIKGKNRYIFENQLVANIKQALTSLGRAKIKTMQGRMLVDIGDIDPAAASHRLSRIFGIASFSPVARVKADTDKIYQAAKAALENAMEKEDTAPGEKITFRVTAKRADKSFPLTSMELAKEVGAYLLKNVPNLKVDLHNPRIIVSIDIRQGQAFIFSDKIPGPGGLPLGTSGKGVLLISGGIDSPVAGWMTMKRGVEIEAVHFHSFPFTGEKSKQKVIDLCRVLAGYSGKIKLHIVHFTDIQKAIHKTCQEDFRITVMRRFMFRIAQRIAEKNGALALVTGESVGQVSSQTLQNMLAINEVTKLPVLRPLVAFDKNEIVALARKIKTYDISIQPYEDCCTLFLPKSPITTKPRLGVILKAESRLNVDEMVEDAMGKIETLTITEDYK
ncbi:MAG: tRNA 4-thiouridine(8) synthase ThiI [Desulfotomaculum sp.]|nr:tRNA 4-thiouridine(8) synthase ThiI [Desulfotomaculum sp.]